MPHSRLNGAMARPRSPSQWTTIFYSTGSRNSLCRLHVVRAALVFPLLTDARRKAQDFLPARAKATTLVALTHKNSFNCTRPGTRGWQMRFSASIRGIPSRFAFRALNCRRFLLFLLAIVIAYAPDDFGHAFGPDDTAANCRGRQFGTGEQTGCGLKL
jgi:hypothetical protein